MALRVAEMQSNILHILHSMPQHDILGYPQTYMERDASKRALIRLRRAKQATGFRSFATSPKAENVLEKSVSKTTADDSACVSSFNNELARLQASGATTSDVVQEYNKALRTYGAEKPMRQSRKQEE